MESCKNPNKKHPIFNYQINFLFGYMTRLKYNVDARCFRLKILSFINIIHQITRGPAFTNGRKCGTKGRQVNSLPTSNPFLFQPATVKV